MDPSRSPTKKSRTQLRMSLENFGIQDVVRSFWMRHEEKFEAVGTGRERPVTRPYRHVDRDLSGGEMARYGCAFDSLVERPTEGLMAGYAEAC